MPEYPAVAKASHVQGDVTVTVLISEDGALKAAHAQGQPLLIAPAEKAVLQWRFNPVTVEGKPVKVQSSLTFRFTLGR